MKINHPESRELVNCAEKRLSWFRRDSCAARISAAGRSAGELAEEMIQRLVGRP